MNRTIPVNIQVTVTMPDGTEETLMASEPQNYAVVYPNQHGKWCLYGTTRTTLAANMRVAAYQEEVGPDAEDYPAQVVATVGNRRAPSLSDRNPFPNGLPR